MEKKFGSMFLGAIICFMTAAPAAFAAPPQWMDASHLFDKVTADLTAKVKIESKADHAKRFKAPIPQPKEYKVGDVESFWTKNIQANTFEQIQATLKAVGKNCYVFLENGKSVSDTAIQNIVKAFDEKIYPTDTGAFGSEWKPGIDGDNRIFLLMFDIKDGFNGTGGYVAGYFFAGDEFLQSQIPANIPVKSNEKEMFYLDLNPADPNSDKYMTIVAHEFQHMIHFIHDPKEFTWLNEACSQIGPYLCGYGHAGQITSYMQTPDNSLTAWSKDQMLANYGQVYLWNYYILNRYLAKKPNLDNFFSTLVSDKEQGTASYNKLLKNYQIDFSKLFVEFAIANFVNDAALDKGQFGYDPTLSRLRLPPVAQVKALPGQVKEKVSLWSADGIKADLSAAKNKINVSFTGSLAKIGGKTNSFTVAAILSNSRNTVKPAISFLKLSASGSGMAGSLDLDRSADFDTLQVVVVNVAPLGGSDKDYAQAPGNPYSLDIRDAGAAVVSRGPSRVNPNRVVEDYLISADVVTSRDKKIAATALSNLENLTSDMGKEVVNNLEEGSTTAVDAMLNAAEDEDARTSLRPLARKLAEQVDAWRLQKNTPSPALEEKIQGLKSF